MYCGLTPPQPRQIPEDTELRLIPSRDQGKQSSPGIKHLRAKYDRLTDEILKKFSTRFPNLETLVLKSKKLNNPDFSGLRTLKKVTFCALNQLDFSCLSTLPPSVEHLCLEGMHLNEDSLKKLQDLDIKVEIIWPDPIFIEI